MNMEYTLKYGMNNPTQKQKRALLHGTNSSVCGLFWNLFTLTYVVCFNSKFIFYFNSDSISVAEPSSQVVKYSITSFSFFLYAVPTAQLLD